ncbi:Phosphoenolpyruvate-protein phosphotransferase of PTS system [Labilithrix luteola]|uniref:Phosphoenolpyruvate-protein phosphotransferase n=1 Tax=Labilithrix luteola TaxID=1391654 RepID=A0A0K1Q9X7_9BACT|nr:phosphoenolpyruvate--protein phosphotransferase [Labilithrix luteola]AKV02596.1 Phosphoenolpyruvate-protein phosphotransferase of PTS system [Labilithrix luteola]
MTERRSSPPKGTPSAPSSGDVLERTPTSIPAAPSSSSSPSASPPSSFDLEPREPTTLKGIAGSPGVAVGPALVLGDLRASFVRRHVHTAQVPGELERVHQAVGTAQKTLREVDSRIANTMREATAILDVYQLMLQDPALHERIEKKISREKKCAEWAVSEAGEEIVAMFGSGGDERDAYILERRHDIEFVADRLLRALVGEDTPHAVRLDEPMIVVARDLSPADTASMVREPALAFVTSVGTRTSHTSIMARALEIPAVVGVADAMQNIRTGDMLVVDGLTGQVFVHPSEATVRDARQRSEQHLAFARRLLSARHKPCVTADNVPVALKANVELPAEAILAVDHGAQGIGLYRTEFLYIDRTTQPGEDEQYEVYRAIVEAVSPQPVTLRTFDIGGDKFASTFQLPAEMNPALGLRAVRLALKQPEVFLTQLRAMVRASAHGDVRIMVPMVASVHEMREVRRLLSQAIEQVKARGQAFEEHIPLGMMIEVPAAAVMADVFAREAEFFSLGTNDLVQYALAIDRASQSLAAQASPFDPAILRLIKFVTDTGANHKRAVSLCGAMASDPLAACLLVGLGLRELSMEAAAIPEIKEAIRRLTVEEAEAIALRALACDSADAVEELLARELAPRLIDLLAGLADDVA